MYERPPAQAGDGASIRAWLERRRSLLAELSRELQSGFQAVAAFNAGGYLDSVERQEELCRRIGEHDQQMPPIRGSREDLQRLEELLRRMNAELKQHADVQAALIEHGGRSLRSFQRIWAMNAPFSSPPAGNPPASAVRKPPAKARERSGQPGQRAGDDPPKD